jgi:hypothetical protein
MMLNGGHLYSLSPKLQPVIALLAHPNNAVPRNLRPEIVEKS